MFRAFRRGADHAHHTLGPVAWVHYFDAKALTEAVEPTFTVVTGQKRRTVGFDEIRDPNRTRRRNRTIGLCTFATRYRASATSTVVVVGTSGREHGLQYADCGGDGFEEPVLQISNKGGLRLKVGGASMIRNVAEVRIESPAPP